MTTDNLYLDDPYLRSCPAEVLAARDGWYLLSRTVFYPGGAGQPPDRGWVRGSEGEEPVPDVRAD